MRWRSFTGSSADSIDASDIEQPYNLEQVRRLFAAANAEWATQVGQDLDETVSQ
jgi:hypothetical protein